MFTNTFPNYDESLVSVSTSILKYYHVDNPGHKSLKELDAIFEERNPRNVVLMLFDGFGYKLMQRNLGKDSFLKNHIIRSISSTFPPTTVAATTAVGSALYPIETGWLGWFSYFKEIDDIVTTFSNLRQSNGEPVKLPNLARKYMPYTSIGTKIHVQNPKVIFTEIATYLDDSLTFPKIASQIQNLLSTHQRNFIYCYWPDPDHTMHELGVQNPDTIKVEQQIDTFIKDLSSNKPEDTLLIIIADHGLIDTEYVYLKDYPALYALLIRSYSMENRAASLWVKDVKTFKDEFSKSPLSKYFILYDKESFLESGLLGKGQKHPMVDELVGDLIVIATNKYSLALEKNDQEFIGIHAGLTEDEMLVPLIVI